MTKKNILIVDDDPAILSIFEYILKEAGFEIKTAVNGESCLAVVRSGSPMDLVFLDLKMPGMSGLETFKEIQKTAPDLSVIIMTGYSEDDQIREVFELGAYGIIYKPFDVEEVMSLIDQLFKVTTLG